MNRTLASASVALALLSSVACGGSSSSLTNSSSDGGDTDGSSPATGDGGSAGDSSALGDGSASQACADWARARCQRYDACSDGLYVQIHWGDEATCESSGVQTCTIGLSSNGTASSAATFEACAQALPAESCADFLGDSPVSACAALAGSLANGAPCVGSSQCQSTYCAVPQYATCGVCAAVPAAGSACAVAADCGARGGLTCAENVCVAFGQASASCSAAAPCGIGFDCVGATKTQPGSCQATVATVGATCDPKRATAASCDPTLELTCDPTTKMCVQNTVVDAGATCGAVGGGEAKCAASGTCVIPTADAGADDAGSDAGAAQTTGTCLAAAATGSPCDTSAGPACIAPAKCVTASDASTAGTCQVANPATCQ
jgi:hypothetical protein